jgi:hypothetical protein
MSIFALVCGKGSAALVGDYRSNTPISIVALVFGDNNVAIDHSSIWQFTIRWTSVKLVHVFMFWWRLVGRWIIRRGIRGFLFPEMVDRYCTTNPSCDTHTTCDRSHSDSVQYRRFY